MRHIAKPMCVRAIAAAGFVALATSGTRNAQAAASQTLELPVVRVTPKQSAAELLRLPDYTMLLFPSGPSATVGELRKLSEERRLERESMLAINPPASVTIHVTGGDASRNRYDSALSAATTFASQRPIELANATPAAGPCAKGQSGIGLVNGKSSGITFAPGAPYHIVGCGFGSSGVVAIAGNSGGGALTLTTTKWTDTEIDATLPASITGVPDQSNATLTVTPNGRLPLQEPGHSFIAVRESMLIRRLDTSYWTSSKGPYEPPAFGTSGAGVTNGSVAFAKVFFRGHCDLNVPLVDVFSTASMPIAPGFGVDTIAVTDTTSQLTIDNDDAREVVSSPFTVTAADDQSVNIHYQLNSTYRKPISAIAKTLQGLVQGPLAFYAALPVGQSVCSGSYDIAVTVTGPRGMAPLTR